MGTTIKACAIALGIILANATASLASSPAPNARSAVLDANATPCCKVCRKGKACGNSCIARDKQCHQPPGCACDAPA